MSKSNTKQIQLPIRKDYYDITSFIRKGYRVAVVMTSLTEKEELAIDDGKTIQLDRGNCTFYVGPKDVYCYGEINFHNHSEDMDVISEFPWFNTYEDHGVCIPARYNYETHTAKTENKLQWFDTTRPERIAQYAHGFIGKPKRTIIFKCRDAKRVTTKRLLAISE